ncbi:MAG TPA: DUF11 domain-containing protein, partial [Anaerolineae bacterium]|nr:DUF11 domain-containing protein [Anaerolineae bacterium]
MKEPIARHRWYKTAGILAPLALLALLILALPIIVRGQGSSPDISKSAQPDPVGAGDVITYTIVVTNNTGGALSNLTVTDTVPAHTTYITGSMNSKTGVLTATQPPSITPSNLMTWTIGSLADGKSITMTFQVAADSPLVNGTPIANTAWLSDATNSQRYSDTATIFVDTLAPASSVSTPANDQWYNSLTSLSGTATDGSGSGVQQVDISIQRLSDNQYWNG